MENHDYVIKVMKYAVIASLSVATFVYIIVFNNSNDIVAIFNSEKNMQIADIANTGLRIYFLGFFFAGINIIMATYFSATERTRDAFLLSIARGCILIVPLVLLLSISLKMTGIWLAFVITELIVTVITIKFKKII